jgi:alanine racemase
MRHILNSAGIERFPNSQYEMVRLGIGVYGISARHDPNLQQIGTLKSTLTQIKQVPASETVGYGRKGRLKTNATIATVPIGYADGLRRNLSQGVGKMLVRGHLAPIIGNICMDMTMLDVTNLDVKEGDEVVIFGPGLPVSQLAEWAQTIPYEILTGISPRVKRVYYRE